MCVCNIYIYIYLYIYIYIYIYIARAKIGPVALALAAWLFETREPEGDAKRRGSPPQLDLEMVYTMIYHDIPWYNPSFKILKCINLGKIWKNDDW